MKTASAISLVVALAGCRQDPTVAAFQRAAAELPAAEAHARDLGLFDHQAQSAQVPDKGITMRSEVVNAVQSLRSKLQDRNDFDLNSGEYVTSQDGSQVSKATEAFGNIWAELDRVRAAASLKPSGFAGIDLVFNKDIHSFKDGVKFLCLRSILLSRKGQPSEAIEDIRAATALSRAPLGSTDMIGQHYAASFQAMAIRAIEWNLTNCPAAILPTLLQVSEELQNPIAIQASFRDQALRELTFTSQSELKSVSKDGGSPQVKALTPTNVPIPLLAKGYRARHLQFWNKVLSLARSGSNHRHLVIELREHTRATRNVKDPTYALLRFFDSDPAGLVDSVLVQQARISALQALGSVLDHRNRTQKWPGSLPGKPVDPFDGKPLRFKFTGDRAVIYSIGKDLEDNAADMEKDIAVRFPAEGR